MNWPWKPFCASSLSDPLNEQYIVAQSLCGSSGSTRSTAIMSIQSTMSSVPYKFRPPQDDGSANAICLGKAALRDRHAANYAVRSRFHAGLTLEYSSTWSTRTPCPSMCLRECLPSYADEGVREDHLKRD